MTELPPVIQLLTDEDLRVLSDPIESFGVLKKGLFRELKTQARWTVDNYAYASGDEQSSKGAFVITPSGAMNPLASGAGCDELRCRVARARTFARTVGLWSDHVCVADVFSAQLQDPGRLTLKWAEAFSRDVAALREILPLVQSGVVSFTDPISILCKKCTTAAIANSTSELTEQFEDTFEFSESWQPGWLAIASPVISDEAIIEYQIPREQQPAAAELIASRKRKRLPTAAGRLRRALVAQFLGEKVEDLPMDLHSAQQLSSILVSSTRSDLLCVQALEQELPELGSIEEWEQPREIQLPWVANLSSSEIVRLREHASSALPRLREMIASGVMGSDGSTTSMKKIVADLRVQAVEVESELTALRVHGRRRDKATLALISAGLALYGFGAAGVSGLAAAGQLVTTLGMIHGFSRTDHTEEAKLKARPGYVLVKARELLTARGHRRHAV